MRKLILELDTDNQAFEDYGILEIKNCLDRAKEKIQEGYFNFSIMDSNGNKIGFCILRED
jgi:hypothetical protein